jgi:hypothetical protein
MNYHEDRVTRITAYTLHLNKPLARAFLKFADAFIKGGAKGIPKGSLNLTNAEYSNFQNLRYMALISQLDKGRDWFITPLGLRFLGGEKILSPVAHLGGETLDDQHLAWSTHPHKRQLLGLADVLPEEWKSREEFKAEKCDAVA